MISTSMRVSEETLRAMRLAASEIAIARNQWIDSDDQRLLALIEYWNQTKSFYGDEQLPGDAIQAGLINRKETQDEPVP